MTQDEFEKLRARLEEQLRADVELLYEAHRVKLRAYETIRRARAELEEGDLSMAAAPLPPGSPQLPAPEPKAAAPLTKSGTRSQAGSILYALEEILDQLPEEFDKNDVHRLLGYVPSRPTLARAFETLRDEGILAVSAPGSGRMPMRFRKCAAASG